MIKKMSSKTKTLIDELLADPQRLIEKKPFTRGTNFANDCTCGFIDKEVPINGKVQARLSTLKRRIVSQDEFVRELDPMSHKVLFDANIPSITMKNKKGQMYELEYKKMAVPYQRLIRDKHVLHLCGNPMQFTLMNTNPTEKQTQCFIDFKQYWNLRNMDGMRTKAVSAQKSYGDAGLLFYFDYKGRIKARLLSYEDGYILCPHNDDNGDRILESVYYSVGDTQYIDSYDDTYMYRWVCEWSDDSVDPYKWRMEKPVTHGFSEIPLVTKRGRVAWDNVQSLIEVYEVIYNVFLVIQKRHGWGILYVKGSFKALSEKLAGSVILNDTSMESKGSADFKTPPSPQNMIDTLGLMEETIQKGSGATFLLPKDVKSSGDISAQAIMLTQSLDIETALQGVIDWQNFADKMCRLFKEGLAKEFVNTGKNLTAITDFEDIDINAKFKVWRPQNDTEYNNMLISLKGAGGISEDTLIEKNTESSPDEKVRRRKEKEEEIKMKEEEMALQYGNNNSDGNNSNNNQNSEGGASKE